MQVKPHELDRHLSRGLAPVYFVFGDEPLQNERSLDLIRSAARAASFDERVSLHADANFDWRQLYEMRDSVSLFAERRLFDVRMGSLRLDKEQGQALKDYLARPNEDNVLLISAGAISWQEQKLAWFKSLSTASVVVRSWPVDNERMPAWVTQRAREAGLQLDPNAARALAEQVEGNLLAAAQEIDVLALLHPGASLSVDQVLESASFSSRYSHNDLADAALSGDAGRIVRVARGLEEEGVPLPLCSWALAHCVRELASLVDRVAAGEPPARAAGSVRNRKRQGVFAAALGRLTPADMRALREQAYWADRAVKGVGREAPWQALLMLALEIGGFAVLPRSS